MYQQLTRRNKAGLVNFWSILFLQYTREAFKKFWIFQTFVSKRHLSRSVFIFCPCFATTQKRGCFDQLYVDLMLLVISFLTLLMSVGCNIPLILTQYVVTVGLVLRFLTIHSTCIYLFNVIRKKSINPIYGYGVKITPLINPLCG